MKAREEHDKTLQGIRKTIEELKAQAPPLPAGEDRKRPHSSSPSPAVSKADQHLEEKTIPVVEERPSVRKELQQTGSIRFRKRVHEEDITVEDSTSQEEVSLQRVAVTPRYVDDNPPAPRQEGTTIIIPVFEEVIEKQLILVEEVRITRHKKHAHSSHPLTLKKEEVRLNRQPTSGSSTKEDPEKRDHL
ncbi:YsnF/AvaK domain-containing protein [Cesiribacter andamanensis]|uniref:DUF2382 domain-containing protein n=1 Tax=Cesiribacter andamanensis AMV16 TaxID=1279009 RepID=M7NYW2_9BACT|nr:YsnF/AvaK domain-containing protein [Cesiribacter andamanensis]EMR03564.1 hypothetical protein ADICEAN_01331 [Cesiribacter andamanensis AMV16]